MDGVYMVTGASSGTGRAIASQSAKRDARVLDRVPAKRFRRGIAAAQ